MRKRIGMPSPAMAVAVVALFAALVGGAYAAEKAAKNTVLSKSIKNGQVKSADLADGGVKAVDLGAGSVGAEELAAGAVGAAALGDGTVGALKLVDGAVGTAKIGDGAVVGAKLADGSVGATKLAPNAVGAVALANGAVTAAKITVDAVDSAKIIDGAVGSAEIGTEAVEADELDAVSTAVGASLATADADGTPNGGAVGLAKATAQCPEGTQLLGGGSRWFDSSSVGTNDANVYVQEEYNSNAGTAWTVEGIVDFGAQGTIRLQAQAYCL